MAWDRFIATLVNVCVLGSVLHGCRVDDTGYTFPAEAGGSSAQSGATSGSGGSSGSSSGSGGTVTEPGAGGTAGAPATCPKGKHACIGGCVPDDDVATCGTSCVPCGRPEDGTATCDGTRCGIECEASKKPCLGACIPEAEACEGTCPAGSHACGDTCPLDDDVNACGTSCDPCSTPAGAAQATCEDGTCGFTCLAGSHACGDACVDDGSVSGCGAECKVCEAPKSGKAACFDGTCAVVCDSGYHLCNGGCVSDASPLSCGGSCEPCQVPEGGEATCKTGSCGGSCPTGKQLCQGKCIAAGAACNNVCASGTHACNDFCVSDSSTNSCAKRCDACPLPMGASETSCATSGCDFECSSAYHRCDDRCAANSDATACGSKCVDCPDDKNGTATCQSDKCGLQCKSGYHLCDGACVSNSSLTSCGASCMACPAVPANANGTCNGTSCGFTCKAGFTGSNCEFSRLQAVPLPAGYAVSSINAMSTDGSFVAGVLESATDVEQARGFRWAISSNAVTIIEPAGDDSDARATALSGDGSRVYGYGTNLTFQWTPSNKTVQLPRATPSTRLYAADLTGTTAVGVVEFFQATLYSSINSGTFSAPMDPEYSTTSFSDISDSGALVVGSASSAGTTYPIRWSSAGGYVRLPGGDGAASAVSADGKFIVGRLGDDPVRWTGSSFQTSLKLTQLTGGTFTSNVRAISTDGTVAVGWSYPRGGGQSMAVIWTNGQPKELIDVAAAAGADTRGWSMDSADNVSANGKIVAGSGSKDDERCSFIVRLP